MSPFPTPPLAELAASTAFSFLRGASRPEEMVAQAVAIGLSALGIADRNSVAGVVRAHDAAKQVGMRLLVGSRLVFRDGTPDLIAYPEDRAAFEAWTKSEEFRRAHARAGNAGSTASLYLEHPKFEGFEVRQTQRRGAAAVA